MTTGNCRGPWHHHRPRLCNRRLGRVGLTLQAGRSGLRGSQLCPMPFQTLRRSRSATKNWPTRLHQPWKLLAREVNTHTNTYWVLLRRIIQVHVYKLQPSFVEMVITSTAKNQKANMPKIITSLASLTMISHKAALRFWGDESALTGLAAVLGRICSSRAQNNCKITDLCERSASGESRQRTMT